jgi:hypothetical protein
VPTGIGRTDLPLPWVANPDGSRRVPPHPRSPSERVTASEDARPRVGYPAGAARLEPPAAPAQARALRVLGSWHCALSAADAVAGAASRAAGSAFTQRPRWVGPLDNRAKNVAELANAPQRRSHVNANGAPSEPRAQLRRRARYAYGSARWRVHWRMHPALLRLGSAWFLRCVGSVAIALCFRSPLLLRPPKRAARRV